MPRGILSYIRLDKFDFFVAVDCIDSFNSSRANHLTGFEVT